MKETPISGSVMRLNSQLFSERRVLNCHWSREVYKELLTGQYGPGHLRWRVNKNRMFNDDESKDDTIQLEGPTSTCLS